MRRAKEAHITDENDIPAREMKAGHAHPSPNERSDRGESAMRNANESKTEDLFGSLMGSDDLAAYLEGLDEAVPSLAEFLQQELAKRGLRQADVLKRAHIEQTFGWYVFNGKRGMGRDNVLKLSFAMGFDVRHANRALQAAGANALYPKARRDAIIMYCLQHGFTLQQANDTLYAFCEDCL